MLPTVVSVYVLAGDGEEEEEDGERLFCACYVDVDPVSRTIPLTRRVHGTAIYAILL
jgi:hypothetical protein